LGFSRVKGAPLRSGRRGRRFESCHYQKKKIRLNVIQIIGDAARRRDNVPQ